MTSFRSLRAVATRKRQCHLVSGHATLASSLSCLSKLSCGWAVNPAEKKSPDTTDPFELAYPPSDSSNPLSSLLLTDRCTSSRTDALDQPWCLILAVVPVDYGRLDPLTLKDRAVLSFISRTLVCHHTWTRPVSFRVVQGRCSS